MNEYTQWLKENNVIRESGFDDNHGYPSSTSVTTSKLYKHQGEYVNHSGYGKGDHDGANYEFDHKPSSGKTTLTNLDNGKEHTITGHPTSFLHVRSVHIH